MSTIEQIDQQIKQKKVEIEGWEKNSGNNLKLDLLNQNTKHVT